MELRSMIPFAYLVAKSFRTDFAHCSEHVDVKISVVVVRVRSVNSHVDDHSLLRKFRCVLLRQRLALFGVDFLRQCDLEGASQLRGVAMLAAIFGLLNSVPK